MLTSLDIEAFENISEFLLKKQGNYRESVVVGWSNLSLQVDVVAFGALDSWAELFDECRNLKIQYTESARTKQCTATAYLLRRVGKLLRFRFRSLDLLNALVALRMLHLADDGVLG